MFSVHSPPSRDGARGQNDARYYGFRVRGNEDGSFTSPKFSVGPGLQRHHFSCDGITEIVDREGCHARRRAKGASNQPSGIDDSLRLDLNGNFAQAKSNHALPVPLHIIKLVDRK